MVVLNHLAGSMQIHHFPHQLQSEDPVLAAEINWIEIRVLFHDILNLGSCYRYAEIRIPFSSHRTLHWVQSCSWQRVFHSDWSTRSVNFNVLLYQCQPYIYIYKRVKVHNFSEPFSCWSMHQMFIINFCQLFIKISTQIYELLEEIGLQNF